MIEYFRRVLDTPAKFEDTEVNRNVGIDQENWVPELTSKQLSQIFDQGASLNIYLRPSKNIKNRTGTETYIENYSLPTLIRENDRYIALSPGHHGLDDNGNGIMRGARSYYCYSNCGAGFYHYLIQFLEAHPTANIAMMNKVRYEEMNWIVKDTHDLIFEGQQFQENLEIVKAIQAGKDFRISLTLPDGREYRMEIELLFYHPESRETNGFTHTHYYPSFFGSPKQLHEYSMSEFRDDNGQFLPEMAKDASDSGQPLVFNIYGDGTYENFYMKANGERVAFKNIKIFASKI